VRGRPQLVMLLGLVVVASARADGDEDMADTDMDAPKSIAAAPTNEGVASWYGGKFHGRLTACGERFNEDDLTAAHRTLPFGTRIAVTNLENGCQVTLRITDRGPYHGDRILDLSRKAAEHLGFLDSGLARVRFDVVDHAPPRRGRSSSVPVAAASPRRGSAAVGSPQPPAIVAPLASTIAQATGPAPVVLAPTVVLPSRGSVVAESSVPSVAAAPASISSAAPASFSLQEPAVALPEPTSAPPPIELASTSISSPSPEPPMLEVPATAFTMPTRAPSPVALASWRIASASLPAPSIPSPPSSVAPPSIAVEAASPVMVAPAPEAWPIVAPPPLLVVVEAPPPQVLVPASPLLPPFQPVATVPPASIAPPAPLVPRLLAPPKVMGLVP